jgi:threonine/homoserine/homoserine lactone efflux protein
MQPSLLLTGSLIGLSIAMPMGPIGMLCLRYSLSKGKSFGLASGMGVALADALCGALAAIGLTALMTFVENNHSLLQLFGSFFLFYFGYKTMRAKRKMDNEPVISSSHLRVFLLMFFITLSNPLTILSFTGIYASIGLDGLEQDFFAIAFLSLGVFLGSATWWLILSSGSSYFGAKITENSTVIIDRIIGSFIMFFSFVALGSALYSLL